MGQRIVVIEADDAVRELLHRWLLDAGHLVDASPSPNTGASVDLVIADVDSPRAGNRVLDELLDPWKGIRVLLISGRFRKGQEGSLQLADELGVEGVLPKPFTRRQLLAAVTQALGR